MRTITLILVVALWVASLWVAFWVGSEDGFLLARKGTYALEYANALTTVNFLECDADELRPVLADYADLQLQGLRSSENQLAIETPPVWKRVVNGLYKTPLTLSRVSDDKATIPPISKIAERIEQLRGNKGPNTSCKH